MWFPWCLVLFLFEWTHKNPSNHFKERENNLNLKKKPTSIALPPIPVGSILPLIWVSFPLNSDKSSESHPSSNLYEDTGLQKNYQKEGPTKLTTSLHTTLWLRKLEFSGSRWVSSAWYQRFSSAEHVLRLDKDEKLYNVPGLFSLLYLHFLQVLPVIHKGRCSSWNRETCGNAKRCRTWCVLWLSWSFSAEESFPRHN